MVAPRTPTTENIDVGDLLERVRDQYPSFVCEDASRSDTSATQEPACFGRVGARYVYFGGDPNEESLVTVLGEAKSDGRFEAKDIARLRKLRKLFPDALLVVATLRHSLSVTERNAIARLAQPRHARDGYATGAPVMVLTATRTPRRPQRPRVLGGRGRTCRGGENKMVSYSTQVRELADITAQIHLHLPPHLEWARSRQ